MDNKKSIIFKLSFISALCMIIIILQIMIIPTVSRLRDVHLDEVRGYYTALHISHDAEGKVVALEEQYDGNTFNGYKGYFSLNLMNYDTDGITQRDIVYKIYKTDIKTNIHGDLYVEGVWGREIPIKDDTVKYTFNIVGEGSTKDTAVEHRLDSYATVDPDATPVGTSNTHMIEVTRNTSAGTWGDNTENEEITIIIELIEPYHEIIVANIAVSPKLIVYSVTTIEKFHTEAIRLHIQTASSFKQYIKDDGTVIEDAYLPDAFRVVLFWENAYFDNTFNTIIKHINNESNPDPGRINTPMLITPNLITTQHTLQMYIPAGSEFYIDFYPTGTNTANFYAYAELKNSSTGIYGEYDKYKHDISKTVDVSVSVGSSTTTNVQMYDISN